VGTVPGRKHRQGVEAAPLERQVGHLPGIDDLAHRAGLRRDQGRRGHHLHAFADVAHLQRQVDAGCLIHEQLDVRRRGPLEPFGLGRDLIDPRLELHDGVIAAGVRGRSLDGPCRSFDQRHRRARHSGAGGVAHGAHHSRRHGLCARRPGPQDAGGQYDHDECLRGHCNLPSDFAGKAFFQLVIYYRHIITMSIVFSTGCAGSGAPQRPGAGMAAFQDMRKRPPRPAAQTGFDCASRRLPFPPGNPNAAQPRRDGFSSSRGKRNEKSRLASLRGEPA
jgi:hypothetical protein